MHVVRVRWGLRDGTPRPEPADAGEPGMPWRSGPLSVGRLILNVLSGRPCSVEMSLVNCWASGFVRLLLHDFAPDDSAWSSASSRRWSLQNGHPRNTARSMIPLASGRCDHMNRSGRRRRSIPMLAPTCHRLIATATTRLPSIESSISRSRDWATDRSDPHGSENDY